MPKHNLTLTNYMVTKCGYFILNARKNPKLFGDVAPTLLALLNWSTGKTLLETKVSENSESGLPTYLMDIVTNNNDYLICLWNESNSNDGDVLSVPLNDPVGTTNVTTTPLPQGNIAGYPTYFWFKPTTQEFFTVQFAGSLNGRLNLHYYLESFLAKFNPDHVVCDSNNSSDPEFNKSINGYRENLTSKVIDDKQIKTCFDSLLTRNQNVKSELNKIVKDIYGLVRKESITANPTLPNSLLGMLIRGIGINTVTSSTTSMEYRLKYEIKFKPSEEEFNQIIDNWSNNENNAWENIGFKVSGKSSPVWIDSTISRGKYDVDIIMRENSVDCLMLLKELQKIQF